MGRYQHEILFGRFVLRNLFQEGGIWYARVRDLATGKVLRHSSREGDRRRAKQIIIDWLDMLRDVKLCVHSPPFTEAYDEWVGLKTVRPSTLQDLKFSANVFRDAFEGFSVDAIKPLTIERFLKQLLEEPRKDSGRKGGRSPRTRNKHLATLRAFFRWAKRQSYSEADPTEGIKLLRVPKRRGIVLTPAQASRLIAAAREKWSCAVKRSRRSRAHEREQPQPEHLWIAILLALQTGLRRANVLGLRWEQVDLDEERIDIVGAEMKGHRDHAVPIHPELVAALRKLKDSLEVQDPAAPVIGLELQSLRKSFLSAVRAMNRDEEEKVLPRWHDLRHTFSTWLAAAEPWAVVQRLMGHEPQAVTWDYVDLLWPTLRAAIQRLPYLITNSTKPQDNASG